MMEPIPTTVKNKALVERRREQIVLAAIELFSHKGFHQTTLRELSEEAGISYGNIYDYIGTKEHIFHLIHEYLCDIAFHELSKAIENVADPIEKLHRMIRAEFKLMDKWSDGILLLYQEGHVLKQPFLGWFLKKERDHVSLFEQAISDCVKQGLLVQCNSRLTANLIKTMVDSWVLKRWDLWGKATAAEAERSILNIILHGLTPSANPPKKNIGALTGRKALVVNADSHIGSACCSVLAGEGAQVVAYMERKDSDSKKAVQLNGGNEVNVYSAHDHGDLNTELLQHIQEKYGPLDIFIQNLSISSFSDESGNTSNSGCGQLLRQTLAQAEDLSPWLIKEMPKSDSGRVIYLAPWGWDQERDPIACESVRSGTIGLTSALSKNLSLEGVNVNCIIPGYITIPQLPERLKTQPTKVLSERLGEVSDIIEAVLFLADSRSRYLTNQVIRVADGSD